jgi:hypothetical protein
MGNLIIGGVIGLLIGWNVLPQPTWVKVLWVKVVAKIKSKDA